MGAEPAPPSFQLASSAELNPKLEDSLWTTTRVVSDVPVGDRTLQSARRELQGRGSPEDALVQSHGQSAVARVVIERNNAPFLNYSAPSGEDRAPAAQAVVAGYGIEYQC